MLAPERKRIRQLKKNSKRQAGHRMRQKDKGLQQLQVRVTLLAHSKAQLVAQQKGLKLFEVYTNAIVNADLANLPPKHNEVLEGELIGTRQISPWIEKPVHARFFRLASHYRTTTSAFSAMLYDYCLIELSEADAEC